MNIYGNDVTEREKAEKALNESLKREHFLAELVRNASVAVGVGYPDGRLGMVNAAFQELTGYTEEELEKTSWNTVLTPPEYLESNVDITERIELQAKLEDSAVRVEEYANQMEALANQRAE